MIRAICKCIEWAHKKCAGHRDEPVLPLELREASHRFANEVSILQGQTMKVRQTADELTDLVAYMQSKDKEK